jgi:ribose transport system permease protein
VFVASTTLCKIFRHWIDGPRRGETEIVIDALPGNPDNINRASDGCYWLALVGIRTPTFDLAARKPGFRRRMVKQVPGDEWLSAGLNHGCVLKFNEAGEVLESYWDPTGISHSTLTSMREHKGYLYLGGLENNRIGRIKLAAADPDWTGYEAYWGGKRRDRRAD